MIQNEPYSHELTSFTHTCSRKCESPCLFFTASKWQCNDSCSFDIVLEPYNALLTCTDLVFNYFTIDPCIKIRQSFTLTVDYLK